MRSPRCRAATLACMFWHEGTLAVLDLEATGVDTSTARVIEVGLFRVEADGASVPLVEELIDPNVPLPARVTQITGIRPEDLAADGGDPVDVLTVTSAAISVLVGDGVPIVIYNATYDWPLLAAEFARHGIPPLPGVPPAILIDPLVLDRHVDRYRRGKRDLVTVAEHYGVPLNGAHRAAGDSAATIAVARRIGERYSRLHLEGPDLVALQVRAHDTWRTSLNEYLTRSGSSRPEITEEWPTG